MALRILRSFQKLKGITDFVSLFLFVVVSGSQCVFQRSYIGNHWFGASSPRWRRERSIATITASDALLLPYSNMSQTFTACSAMTNRLGSPCWLLHRIILMTVLRKRPFHQRLGWNTRTAVVRVNRAFIPLQETAHCQHGHSNRILSRFVERWCQIPIKPDVRSWRKIVRRWYREGHNGKGSICFI